MSGIFSRVVFIIRISLDFTANEATHSENKDFKLTEIN